MGLKSGEIGLLFKEVLRVGRDQDLERSLESERFVSTYPLEDEEECSMNRIEIQGRKTRRTASK